MKIGVIGAGGMGFTHIRALKQLAPELNLEVTAAADVQEKCRARVLTEWPDARLYADGRELLEKEAPDAVHICTPSYLHADLIAAAIKKGIPVLTEKPACLSEADCDRLLTAQKESGVTVMVGQVVRFFPEYRYLRSAIQGGSLGALKSLSLQRLSGDVPWGWEDWFHDEEKSGSVVLDLHIHDLDFLRYTFGEPARADVTATAFESGMPNRITASYAFPGLDAPVSAEGLWGRSPKTPFCARYYAQFAEADLVFDGTKVTLYRRDGGVETPDVNAACAGDEAVQGMNISVFGPYCAEIRYFYRCLQRGEQPVIADLSEGIASVRLALKEYALAKNYLKGERS